MNKITRHGATRPPAATSPPSCTPTRIWQAREPGPLIITEGKGVYVQDDPESYIEGLAGLWCTSLASARSA